MLEKFNMKLRKTLSLSQWKNTKAMTDWFAGIQNKSKATFIQFDIITFYLSLTENTLNETINLAKQDVHITDDETKIIKHCQKSLLIHKKEPW